MLLTNNVNYLKEPQTEASQQYLLFEELQLKCLMANKMQILPLAQVTNPGCITVLVYTGVVRVSERAPLVPLQRPTDWSTLPFTYHSRNYLRCFCRRPS